MAQFRKALCAKRAAGYPCADRVLPSNTVFSPGAHPGPIIEAPRGLDPIREFSSAIKLGFMLHAVHGCSSWWETE